MESRRVAQIVTLAALVLALAHILWPHAAIDGITVILIVIAMIPWLGVLFRSLEFPGGWKVEYRELRDAADRADSAGLLVAPSQVSSDSSFSFERVAGEDPNLALAGLRIEIEKRLASLAEKRGLNPRRKGIGSLLRELGEREVLAPVERSVLADMIGLLNNAVHGARVEPRSAQWAVEVGPRLLMALDERIAES